MLKYLAIVGLIMLSALFSGLTLGLMGLDIFDLKRKAELGNKDAKRVYEIRERGNLLLSTLVLGNIAVTSIISILLDGIAGGFMAGIIATGVIFIFGEVLPQASVPRFALRFGSATAPITKIFIFIFYPICGPIAYILDKVLGSELQTVYSKNEIAQLVAEHEDNPSSSIDADEERIIHGALQYSEKKVEDIMTPISVVVFVNVNDYLDEALLQKIKHSGRSRFPVLGEDGKKIVGVLYAKDLVGEIFEKSKKVGSLARVRVLTTGGHDRLDNVLNRFLETRMHLFIVEDTDGSVKGIVTIEDIIEEILKREIVDESDKHADMRQFARSIEKK